MKRIRKILYFLGLLSGFFSFTKSGTFIGLFLDMDFSNPIMVGFFSFYLIMVSMFPYLGLLFIIGMQSINPFSAKQWIKPSHKSNPFNLMQPLLFFHFASYCVLFWSIGILASSLMAGWRVLCDGALMLALSINMIFAVRLCQRIFKNKFECRID